VSSIKDTILNAQDLKWKDVPVEEWGVTVRVMSFTDEQVGAWRAKTQALRMKQRRGDPDVDIEVEMKHRRAELLVHCLRDPEDGSRIFVDGDAPRLATKSAGVMQALDDLAIELSGLDKTYKEQVKDAEADFSSGQN
jgi:hypothetical protein